MNDSQPDIKDWRGTKIDVGDTVIYPVRQGSTTDMNEAVVTGFGVVEAQKSWRDDPDKTILLQWKRSSSHWENEWRKVTKVQITAPKNLTVIKKVEAPDSIYGPHTEMRHPEWKACKS